MTLRLFYHPLSSFCHKALVALYENNTPFEPVFVDLGNAQSSAELRRLWPRAQFPVLHDTARNATVPESSIIIEYLAYHYPGPINLMGATPEQALEVRQQDRFYDLHVQVPMQKIVGDRIRPAGAKDPFGVEQARAALRTALDIAERTLAGRTWAAGATFTMADCAAAPALYYANRVMAFDQTHMNLTAYFQRLQLRASYARVMAEAAPYLAMFPE